MLVVGVERVFHLDQMDDEGFAVLTGNLRGCPSRFDVGAWRRNVVWNEVDRFCHRTSPWDLLRGRDVVMSYDEHTMPRWTRKFYIGRGYITTRNKYMRCEKLFYGQDVERRRFVTVKATPGNVELRDVSGLLLRRTLSPSDISDRWSSRSRRCRAWRWCPIVTGLCLWSWPLHRRITASEGRPQTRALHRLSPACEGQYEKGHGPGPFLFHCAQDKRGPRVEYLIDRPVGRRRPPPATRPPGRRNGLVPGRR
jgi:hypothetical protein